MAAYTHLNSICAAQLNAWHKEYRTAMLVTVRSCGDVQVELGVHEYEKTYVDTHAEDTDKLLSWLRWHKVPHYQYICGIEPDSCSCQYTTQAWSPEDGGLCPCGGTSCDGTCDR